jgi:hypothetical protein
MVGFLKKFYIHIYLRDGPFNFQGLEVVVMVFFFLKKYSDSQCC